MIKKAKRSAFLERKPKTKTAAGVIAMADSRLCKIIEGLFEFAAQPSEEERKDVQAIRIGVLPWDKQKAEESLDSVFEHVTGKARSAITWYQQSRRPKKEGAICLRVGAILLGAAGGVLPVLSELIGKNGVTAFSPTWSSVALGVAAVFLLLDRFFGYSSAWMRYTKAELRIQRLLDCFELDWQVERLLENGETPGAEKIRKLLETARNFLDQVNQAVQEETNAWIEEFKSALKEISELIKAKEEATRQGGLNVEVVNGNECDKEWTLKVDGATSGKYTGKTAGLRNLLPGIHTVRVEGTITGQDKVAEVTVSVPAGGIASAQLTLS